MAPDTHTRTVDLHTQQFYSTLMCIVIVMDIFFLDADVIFLRKFLCLFHRVFSTSLRCSSTLRWKNIMGAASSLQQRVCGGCGAFGCT